MSSLSNRSLRANWRNLRLSFPRVLIFRVRADSVARWLTWKFHWLHRHIIFYVRHDYSRHHHHHLICSISRTRAWNSIFSILGSAQPACSVSKIVGGDEMKWEKWKSGVANSFSPGKSQQISGDFHAPKCSKNGNCLTMWMEIQLNWCKSLLLFCILRATFSTWKYFHNKFQKFQLVESHFPQFIVQTNIEEPFVRIFRIQPKRRAREREFLQRTERLNWKIARH